MEFLIREELQIRPLFIELCLVSVVDSLARAGERFGRHRVWYQMTERLFWVGWVTGTTIVFYCQASRVRIACQVGQERGTG